MQKFKIIDLLDKLFISVCVFLLLYAWLNFYLRNLWLTFVLSTIFCFAIMFIFNYVTEKRNQKKNITKELQKEIDKNYYAFKLTPAKEKLAIINQILTKTCSTTLLNDAITYTLNNKTHLILFATKQTKLTQNEMLNLLENFLNIKVDIIEIVCEAKETNLTTEIYKDKEIKIIDKSALYLNYFKKEGIYPDCTNLMLERKKTPFKQVVLNFFTPEKAKGYFFCGLVLIFSSIMLPYHIYYLVFGSVLLMFSILCKVKSVFKN